MVKVFLLASVMLAVFVSPVFSLEVVIKAGTEFSATSSSSIDSGKMSVGDEANFELAADLVGVSATIPKGSELLGRVVEVEKLDASGNSRVVIMFDFLKVLEEYYSISASVVAVTGAANVQIEESEVFVGGTQLSTKGSDVSISKGTSFKLKVINDVTNE